MLIFILILIQSIRDGIQIFGHATRAFML